MLYCNYRAIIELSLDGYMDGFFSVKKQPIILDYANQELTEDILDGIILFLEDPMENVYELNLLETGITKEQIRRLESSVMGNATLKVLKIQTYADDPDDIRSIIDRMQAHVGEEHIRGQGLSFAASRLR